MQVETRNPDTTSDPTWKKTQGLALNAASPVLVRVHQPPTTTVVELGPNVDPESEAALLVKSGLVSSEGLVQAEDDQLPAERQLYRRKVKRIVEVPCQRKVKVPVTTKKIVETTEKQRIKTTELQTVEEWKEVPETYIEIEEVEAVRMKEIWVKKMIPQKYTKKVEVEKQRMVTIPVQRTVERECWKEIDMEVKKEVAVPGYRIDEVIDKRLVEVDGWQDVEMTPVIKQLSGVKIESSRFLDDGEVPDY
eukprot:TRINITY_DN66791_c6_g1_i1.p1 TRINITY_DN66791_c6_g1~~TRINITY_DN66791_c6_g1_i1.p1  ORF type:complete len:267 (-),score=31.48 TRINITY_DN66791_c6_g1_i1:23-769(-)